MDFLKSISIAASGLRAQAGRMRIIADDFRNRVFTKGAVLVDGFVHGSWKLTRHRDTATLTIELFKALSKQDHIAVTEEGARLLTFAAADADSRDVQFAPAD